MAINTQDGAIAVSYRDLRGAKSALTADYSYADIKIDHNPRFNQGGALDIFLVEHGFKEGERYCSELGEKHDLTPSQTEQLNTIVDQHAVETDITGGGSSANTMMTVSNLLKGRGFKTKFFTLVAGSGEHTVRKDYHDGGIITIPSPEQVAEHVLSSGNIPLMPKAYVYNYTNVDGKGYRFHLKSPHNTTKEFVRSLFAGEEGVIDENKLREHVENADYLFLQGSAWDKLGEDFMNALTSLRWQLIKEGKKPKPLVLTLPTNPKSEWKRNYGWILPSANVIFSNIDELCSHFDVPDHPPRQKPAESLEEYQSSLRNYRTSVVEELNRTRVLNIEHASHEYQQAHATYINALEKFMPAIDACCAAYGVTESGTGVCLSAPEQEASCSAALTSYYALIDAAEPYVMERLGDYLQSGGRSTSDHNNGIKISQVAFITLAERGIAVIEPGKKTLRVEVPKEMRHYLCDSHELNTVGAGDNCYAGILTGLQLGLEPIEAAELGNILAAAKLTLPTARHSNPWKILEDRVNDEVLQRIMKSALSRDYPLIKEEVRANGGVIHSSNGR